MQLHFRVTRPFHICVKSEALLIDPVPQTLCQVTNGNGVQRVRHCSFSALLAEAQDRGGSRDGHELGGLEASF
jgi:hypothetical protein